MNLKTISMIAAGLFSIAGCGQQTNFTINGKLNGANKDTLLLQEMTEKSLELRSKIVTDATGSFNYSDTAGNPRLFFIQNNQNEYITLLILSGEKIKVTAEKGKVNKTLRLSGSPQSELVLELNRELVKATGKLDSLGKQYQDLKGKGNDTQADTWAQGEYAKLVEEQRIFVKAFIDRHVDEPASLLALSHQLNQQPVLNGSADFDYFKKVDAQLYKKYPKSILILNLHKYVEAMKVQIEAAQSQAKATGSGTVAPDISLPDPAGNTQTLSSLRGKIVLLDFWAAWCGPCRRENPNLVAAYAKYHDKGFEIFQVSLDRTKPEWEAAIKKDSLNWIHVSDLKFWSSPVAQQYGVQSIPANFLLDKEGKIIASNLRGPALEEALAKLFR
jgi:peroxiredoxin